MTTPFIPRVVADRLRACVDAIAIDPSGFDMSKWWQSTNCGTVMCLAGQYNELRGYLPNLVAGVGFVNECGFGAAGPALFFADCGLTLFYLVPGQKFHGADWIFHKCRWPQAQQDLYKSGQRVEALRQAVTIYLKQYEIPEVVAETADGVEVEQEKSVDA